VSNIQNDKFYENLKELREEVQTMKLTIESYVTAVDEKDPEKGNHKVWHIVKEDNGSTENYPSLKEYEVVGTVSDILWESKLRDFKEVVNVK
jgi:hypothetical protein